MLTEKAILSYTCGSPTIGSPPSPRVYSLASGLVPGSSGGYWLVHTVVPPMGLQTLSAPCILSILPPLGTLYSVQISAKSIHLCICQALAEPLRGQLYQAPFSKHLSSTIVSGFGDCKWDGSPSESVPRWSFLQSLLHTLSL